MKLAAAAILLLSHAAIAQTQTAPTGATGICKDGSFTTSPAKDGACHGHKGIQTWYGAVSSPARPVPMPGGAAASLAAPTVTGQTPHALPAPTPAPATAATLPTPTSAQAIPSRPAATLQPSAPASSLAAPKPLTAVPSLAAPQPGQLGIAAERSRMASAPPAPGGGPGLVWVNTTSKVYHCPGSDFYGKTKSGSYMSEVDAKSQGAHPNRNKPCS